MSQCNSINRRHADVDRELLVVLPVASDSWLFVTLSVSTVSTRRERRRFHCVLVRVLIKLLCFSSHYMNRMKQRLFYYRVNRRRKDRRHFYIEGEYWWVITVSHALKFNASAQYSVFSTNCLVSVVGVKSKTKQIWDVRLCLTCTLNCIVFYATKLVLCAPEAVALASTTIGDRPVR